MSNNYLGRMRDEYEELSGRIERLHNYIYSDRSENDDKVEYANKCIQLAAMKKYAEALECRIRNAEADQEVEGTYLTIHFI